jgi:hypothetical protein
VGNASLPLALFALTLEGGCGDVGSFTRITMRFLKSPFLWIVFIVVLFYGITAAYVIHKFGITQEASWFGELFGGINGVFTAIGAGAAIYALRMQQREIEARTDSLQRGQQELQQQTRLLSQQITDRLGPSSVYVRAEMQKDIASTLLGGMEHGVVCDLGHISDPVKFKAAHLAFEQDCAAWEAHLAAWIAFRDVLFPVTGTRSHVCMPKFEEARLREQRAIQLEELRTWIRDTYVKLPDDVIGT